MDVRAEPFSIPVVRSVVKSYAKNHGLSDYDTGRFLITVEEAMAQVIEFGFPDNHDAMFRVSASVDDMDFRIVIKDKGIPYDYDYLSRSEDTAASMSLLKGFADKVQIRCLGAEGREQTLIKRLTALPEYRDNTDDDAGSAECGSDGNALQPSDIQYCMLRPEHAIEVAQCIYDEFGYSYIHDIVYYPDEFYASTLRGECISMVATAPDGEVAGHLALVGSPTLKGTMEIAMGVVKKKFRNCSIMNVLTERLMRHGREIGLTSINSHPVMYHVFTQKICNKTAMYPCGFEFNIANEDMETSFDSGFRGCVAVAVNPINDVHRRIYVSERVLPIVRYVIDTGKYDREVVTDVCALPDGESEVTMDVDTRTDAGLIVVDRVCSDIASDLRDRDHYIRSQKCMVSQIFINICDPCAIAAYDAAIGLGYICTGMFPGCSNCDYLMMESIIYSIAEYDKMQTIEPFSGLLKLVREGDVDG